MLIINELKYINKIFQEPQVWLESKLNHEMMYDPLARVLMVEIGLALTKVGTFLPGLHLKKLFEDKDRMAKFKSIGYPADIKNIEELTEFLERYEDESITAKVLEQHIKKEYVRRKLKQLSLRLSEDLIDSTKSEEEVLRKLSVSIDNLLYDEEDSVERYSTDEIVANEIQYQNSGEVQLFEKSGISLIDKIAGGIPRPSLNFVLGNSKSGKSLALYNALVSRLESGKKCIFATIETNTQETIAKIFSCYTGYEYSQIRQKTLTADEQKDYIEKVREFGEKYRDQLYLYYNKDGCSPKDVEIYWSVLNRSGIDIEDIYIDYIGIMKSSDPSKKSTVDIMLSLPKELRILSQKTNTSVYSAQQLSSEAERMDIKDITFKDVYYSTTIAHESSNTIVVKRGENGELYTKYLPSRFTWTDQIFHYPNKEFNRCYLGDVEELDGGNDAW